MRPVGLKQQSKQIESYCDSRQQTATATATNTEAEPAAKQFVSPPSNLSSKANVLQFVNKKISLRFLRLLGPVCSRSVCAPPPTLVYIVCAVVSFVVYTLLGISQSQSQLQFLFVSLSLSFTFSLAAALQMKIVHECCLSDKRQMSAWVSCVCLAL